MANLVPRRNGRESGEFPFAVSRIRSDMERFFDRYFESPLSSLGAMSAQDAWLPAVDVKDRPDELTVLAELPGLKAEDIDPSANNSRRRFGMR